MWRINTRDTRPPPTPTGLLHDTLNSSTIWIGCGLVGIDGLAGQTINTTGGHPKRRCARLSDDDDFHFFPGSNEPASQQDNGQAAGGSVGAPPSRGALQAAKGDSGWQRMFGRGTTLRYAWRWPKDGISMGTGGWDAFHEHTCRIFGIQFCLMSPSFISFTFPPISLLVWW